MRCKVLLLVSCLLFSICSSCFAKEVIFTGECQHNIGIDETRVESEKIAINDAKINALSRADAFIESFSEVREGIISKDEFKSLIMEIITPVQDSIIKKYELVDTEHGVTTLYLKADFVIESNDVELLLEKITNQGKTNDLLAREKYAEALTYKRTGPEAYKNPKAQESNRKYIALCEQALQLKPDYVDVYLELASIYNPFEVSGVEDSLKYPENFMKCREYAEKALLYDKNNPKIYKMLAESYGRMGNDVTEDDSQKVVLYTTKAIELDPSDDELYGRRASANTSLHNYKEALKDFNYLLEKCNNSVDRYFYLSARARVYSGMHIYDKAVDDYISIFDDRELESEMSKRKLVYHRIVGATYSDALITCEIASKEGTENTKGLIGTHILDWAEKNYYRGHLLKEDAPMLLINAGFSMHLLYHIEDNQEDLDIAARYYNLVTNNAKWQGTNVFDLASRLLDYVKVDREEASKF